MTRSTAPPGTNNVSAPLPPNENARLEALRRYDILDTLAEQSYDDITRIASYVTDTPISLISLVDEDRQWFKSRVGLSICETPREYAFCAQAILDPDHALVVADARRDERFADNALVKGEPDIRFYMGAPLVTHDRHALGTLCVMDKVPHTPSPEQIEALEALARQVVRQLELRRLSMDLKNTVAERDKYLADLQQYRVELEQRNAQLLERSLTDHLTRVGNRAALDERLDAETYRTKRYGLPLSLLLIDVDHFKAYNDDFGHPAGDVALQAVAQVLGNVRPSDFLARYGGEEFAVILPSTEGTVACILAERLRSSIEMTSFPLRPITVSVGAATVPPGSAPRALLESADRALYAAKQRGRNCVVHADSI